MFACWWLISSAFFPRPAIRRLLCTVSLLEPKDRIKTDERRAKGNPQPTAAVSGSGYILEYNTGILVVTEPREPYFLRAGKQFSFPLGHNSVCVPKCNSYKTLGVIIVGDKRYGLLIVIYSALLQLAPFVLRQHSRWPAPCFYSRY